jgi:Putative addiction module component
MRYTVKINRQASRDREAIPSQSRVLCGHPRPKSERRSACRRYGVSAYILGPRNTLNTRKGKPQRFRFPTSGHHLELERERFVNTKKAIPRPRLPRNGDVTAQIQSPLEFFACFAGPRRYADTPIRRHASPSVVRKILFGQLISCANSQGVGGLAEVQEAIEKLAPEERALLLDWLESFDSDLEQDWAKEANQRFEELSSGKDQSVDALEAIDEIRRQIRQ